MILVIVESPTKAKIIKRFLGKDYTVRSSYGHIRDLARKGLGIEIENNFKQIYEVPEKAEPVVEELAQLAKKAKKVILATDEDREGEAIAWHITQAIGLKTSEGSKPAVERIVFHEITKPAILDAIAHPRSISKHRVDAQKARRVLDRLVGYKLSPILWSKVARGLSAGRVQSVAVRLIVEREDEINRFKVQEFWTMGASLTKKGAVKTAIESQLTHVGKKKLEKFTLDKKAKVTEIEKDLKKAKFSISDIKERATKKNPYPPYTTSSLQQDASIKLHQSPKQTMYHAQKLYEGKKVGKRGVGLITYMRTDSVSMAASATKQAHELIKEEYGDKYLFSRGFKAKKGAQEAHEAIRPTSFKRTPESMRKYLKDGEYKLYRLIWQRALASQMAPAEFISTNIKVDAKSKKDYKLSSRGIVKTFDGFMKVYTMKSEDRVLPKGLEKGDELDLKKIISEKHETQPPARYSEAGLVKVMEKHGIGRPSTYAPTISTVQDRGYVVKNDDRRLAPTEVAIMVTKLLTDHFTDYVDYEFTADMENGLDKIASGDKKWDDYLSKFWKVFEKLLMKKDKELKKAKISEEKVDSKCPECGKDQIKKMSRFGPFLACTGYPDCKKTVPLENGKKAKEEKLDRNCPECKQGLVYKMGKYGKFIGCSGYPDCKHIERIEVKSGVNCPKCKKGEFCMRKSRKGRVFWGCNSYPDCENALWDKPNGKTCKTCKELMVDRNEKSVCSNKECKTNAKAKKKPAKK